VVNMNATKAPPTYGPGAQAAVTTAAAPTAAAPTAPATTAPAERVTFAGSTQGGAASIAIAVKDGHAVAYLCDGNRAEAWLQGTATGGALALTGTGNASLTGTYGNGAASGSVTAAGRTWTFSIKEVKPPSGLYRSTATVRNATVVGGWIVLANGKQVGVLNVAGTPEPAPELALAPDGSGGTATVEGTTITAVDVEGSPL
jgi:serine/threonine-protein kinase